MVNTKTLKLTTKRIKGTVNVSEILRVNPNLKHFEPITEEEKQQYRESIKTMKKQIYNLNITDDLRKKKVSELTEEEKDKLYDEYVYNSLIRSSYSSIKYGGCDIKYLFEEIEKEFGVTRT